MNVSKKWKEIVYMQGKIVSLDGFKAVGMTYFGDNNNGEIPKMWQIFNQKFMEISNMSKPVLFLWNL